MGEMALYGKSKFQEILNYMLLVLHMIKCKIRACSNLNSVKNKPTIFTEKTQAFKGFAIK